MTVERGAAWGRLIACPADLREVGSDRDLALALTDGSGLPTAVRSGDMLRTLGGRVARDPAPNGNGTEREVLAAPVDLIGLLLDGRSPEHAVAHVLVRAPRRRGGPLRESIILVMNAEFMGPWDVAPRSHPNDGRVEVVSCTAAMGVRQRLAARRRLTTAEHVPHPDVSTRSVTEASWTFDRPMVVVADGHPLGTARTLEMVVRPDAATLHV